MKVTEARTAATVGPQKDEIMMTIMNNEPRLPVKPDLAPSTEDAISFLRRFTPAGPWVLSAISEGRRDVPTVTFKPGDEAAITRWIEGRQAELANIYFLVGEPFEPLSKKPKKAQMARSRWLWADLDARAGLDWLDAEAVSAEMSGLRARLDACTLPPTVIVNSGGGLQAFWHLAEPFELDGDAKRIAELEALNKALAAVLNADHCHNADRIMRLPGTVNFPNAKKRTSGRKPALATLVLSTEGLAYPAEAFRTLAPITAAPTINLPKRLRRMINSAPAEGKRSNSFYAACCALFEHGLSEDETQAAFETASSGVGAKFIERGDLGEEIARIRQKWQEKRHERQENHKTAGFQWPELTPKGEPLGRSQPNIHAFLESAGVALSYDQMAYRSIITRDGKARTLEDDVARDLWLEADMLGLKSGEAYFTAVLESFARRNGFHPLKDYLDCLQWDGVKRLDKWLHTYLGVENTELNAAFGRKHLIAAVRRIRQPGAKYDTILVLQGRQGRGKSSAVRALCPSEDYFTDNLGVGVDQKEIIEVTTGKWLVELAELDGMSKKEASTIKAMISRQADGARLAYGRSTTERRRQFVLFGTVNDAHYLRDTTGNRRFWPVSIGSEYDPDEAVERIARDRDQLWAEAAHFEAEGESLVLPKHLWEVAAEGQHSRLIVDPWHERLSELFEQRQGFIPSNEIYEALGVATERRNTGVSQRIAGILTNMGFERVRRQTGTRREWGYEAK